MDVSLAPSRVRGFGVVFAIFFCYAECDSGPAGSAQRTARIQKSIDVRIQVAGFTER
jgi:hypothetical protein